PAATTRHSCAEERSKSRPGDQRAQGSASRRAQGDATRSAHTARAACAQGDDAPATDADTGPAGAQERAGKGKPGRRTAPTRPWPTTGEINRQAAADAKAGSQAWMKRACVRDACVGFPSALTLAVLAPWRSSLVSLSSQVHGFRRARRPQGAV